MQVKMERMRHCSRFFEMQLVTSYLQRAFQHGWLHESLGAKQEISVAKLGI
jgi:hypothetical protein